MRSGITLFTYVLAIAILHSTAHGQGAPESISFQGYLADNLGDVVPDGTYNILFKMYKGSDVVWQQNQLNVPVNSGVFNVTLSGTVTHPLDTVAFNSPIDLGITINGGIEISPRTPLTSSAYALGMRGLHVEWAEAGIEKSYNVVGGASNNYVADGVVGATIGGGGGENANGEVPDSVLGDWGTVSGGWWNTAGRTSSVGGGENNKATGVASTVAGGAGNRASGVFATVGGGTGNTSGNDVAFVGGGADNTASGSESVVGGGTLNSAAGPNATVGGGAGNTALAYASTIGGGRLNKASGEMATVPGGHGNTADGETSFAAGWLAGAKHNGTFVWQDSAATDTDTLKSTGDYQFLARASGGFFLYTGTSPDLTTGISLPAGSGTWTALSSESSKNNFREVDARSYLNRVASLELKEWSYKTEQGVTHVGPMAEDFYAAFGHGPTENGISGVDGDGVALAAIQGLYELVKEQQAEIERMRTAMMRAGIE